MLHRMSAVLELQVRLHAMVPTHYIQMFLEALSASFAIMPCTAPSGWDVIVYLDLPGTQVGLEVNHRHANLVQHAIQLLVRS